MTVKSLTSMFALAFTLVLTPLSQAAAVDKVLADEWGIKTNAPLATPFARSIYAAMTSLHSTVKAGRDMDTVQGQMKNLMASMSGGDKAPPATAEEMKLASASVSFMSRLFAALTPNANLQTFIGMDTTPNHQILHGLLSQQSPVYRTNVATFASTGVRFASSSFSTQQSAAILALSKMIDEVTARWALNGFNDDDSVGVLPFEKQLSATTLHKAKFQRALILYADSLKAGNTLF